MTISPNDAVEGIPPMDRSAPKGEAAGLDDGFDKTSGAAMSRAGVGPVTSLPNRRRKSEEVMAKLLDCAEELFARWGYAGVSVRDVTEFAQMRLANVSYYFGSKENLYFEVLRRRSEPLATARIARLQAVIESDLRGDQRLAAIVDAYVDPALEFSQSGDRGWKNYFKLIGHVTFSSLWPEEIPRYYNEPAYRLIEALRQLYPGATPASLQAVALMMLGPYIFVLAETGRIETFKDAAFSSNDVAFQAPLLKHFLVGGVRKALSGEP